MNLIFTTFARNHMWGRLSFSFAKWSKPAPIPNKIKEKRSAKALGDDKAAKLSKSQQENEAKKKKEDEDRMMEQTKLKIQRIKNHAPELEQYVSKQALQRLYDQQLLKIQGILPKKRKPLPKPEPVREEDAFPLPNQLFAKDEATGKTKRTEPIYGNYKSFINNKFSLQQFEPSKPLLRRVGAVGVKLGMTTMWDDWGRCIPVTAIEMDRVQVVQVRQPQGHDGFFHVQVGLGEANLKNITKPLLGHFMKATVPPKKDVVEFKVSEECLLPVGYMLGARHYTPGMYVDVISRSVGHGFTGTIRRFGFRRQPATHGNSVTTRVLGSTGCRQDPGRVFKMKKMYGRYGQDLVMQEALRVFKIDCNRNIIYLYGSVPGKAGTLVKIRDCLHLKKDAVNQELAHYPTFVEEPGKAYANEFKMFAGERDPQEIEYHDNAYILDDKDEEGGAAASSGGSAALPDD